MKVKKNIFFTSDWHIGHDNVLQYDKRPFKSIEDMCDGLIRRYNSVVPENGTCYFLGDFEMTNFDLGKEVLSKLNGIKICIVGNHDRKPIQLQNMGFHAVIHGAIMKIAGKYVSLSHYPLKGVFRENTRGMKGADKDENWHGELRNGHRFMNEGQFHLHGHVHSPNHRTIHTGAEFFTEKILGKQYDVGVAANNYTPVSISTIEKWINNYKPAPVV